MDILERLTPARLPSHTIICDPADPQNPCLVRSTLASSPTATGLLLLGTGRDSRREIKAHYRLVAKRKRLKVVVEVRVSIPRSQVPKDYEGDDGGADEAEHEAEHEGEDGNGGGDYETRNWRLEARWIEAQVFMWRGAVDGNEQSWELGEAIQGSYDGGDREVKLEDMSVEVKDEVEEKVELGDLVLKGDSEWAQPVLFGGGDVVDPFAVEW